MVKDLLRRVTVVLREAIIAVTHNDKLVDGFGRAPQKGSPSC
jgi:hypothetical protein